VGVGGGDVGSRAPTTTDPEELDRVADAVG
jgi:hypothetical protein